MDRLIREARQLGKSPEIATALLAAETKWDNVCESLDKRGEVLKKATDAWAKYENLAGQVEKKLNQQEKSIEDLPNITFTEINVLEGQLRSAKVNKKNFVMCLCN